MFIFANNFNQDLSRWDVSSGTSFVSLGWILVLCSFLLEHVRFWNNSNTDLLLCSLLQLYMFYEATNFNQNINGWDVSSGIIFVSLGLILVLCSFLLEHVRFWNYSITDLLLCSLLQYQMFYGANNFNQNLNGWNVSSGTSFVSLGWILVLFAHLYIKKRVIWNDSNTDFVTLFTATVSNVFRCSGSWVQRSYQLQSGYQWMGCIKWRRLCEFRIDSCTLLILT